MDSFSSMGGNGPRILLPGFGILSPANFCEDVEFNLGLSFFLGGGGGDKYGEGGLCALQHRGRGALKDGH